MTTIDGITEQLIHVLDNLKAKFDEGKKTPKDDTYFFYVKKETDPIFDLLDEWEKTAIELIKQNKLLLHEQQIVATKDNMKALLLHSYYFDVRKRRYMEIYKSIHYIFKQMVKESKQ